MSDQARAELAPTGVLRAGINLSNFLLVTGRSPTSEPEGVAPDVAREIANSLGVPVHYVTFKSPGELADQAGKNVWDIGLIGAEPQRAAVMTFSAAYVEIEATYMVPPGSPIKSIADVDKKGVRPGLLKDLEKHPELKILDGKFTAVQQAVGCNKPATEGARYIAEFVEKA